MATKKNTTVTAKDGKEYAYYRITRTIGHEWKDGKKVPIKKQFVGTSKGNAEQKYKAYLQEEAEAKHRKEAGIQAAKSKTFGEYAEEYTYTALPVQNYAQGTKKQYEQKYRVHIKKSFLMSLPVSEITAKTIQGYYNGLSVSDSVLSGIHKWMSAFYKWLVLNDYSSDVLSAVTLPKKENKEPSEIIVWDTDEMAAIFSASGGFRYRLSIFLMYYAGLRISECLGLKYADIADNNLISINRQFYRGEICAPKHSSNRKLPVHPAVASALQTHKKWHYKEMEHCKYSTEFIFTTHTGKLLDYHNVRTAFIRFYKRNQLPEKKLHAYRATFCTELCRAGVPLEVASKLMGHKSIEVTAKHYALVKQDVKIDAINRLPNYI